MASPRPGARYTPLGPAVPKLEDGRPPVSAPSTARSASSSRIPQTSFSSSRRSSGPQPSGSRPPLTHQSQKWSSAMAPSNTAGPSLSRPRTTRIPSASAAASPTPLSQRPNTASRDPFRNRSHSSKPAASAREYNPPSSHSRSQTPLTLDRGLTQSPVEQTKAEATVYPELDRYRHVQYPLIPESQSAKQHPDALFRLATEGLPSAHYAATSSSQVYSFGSSPSTRFSESPSSAAYSRDTTPTSISSYSPGLVSSARLPSVARGRQTSRSRAGSFGKDSVDAGSAALPIQPLAAIRESLNSSSSSSNGTVRTGDNKTKHIKKKRLSPLPPSPPPRKSSQKFRSPPAKGKEDEPALPIQKQSEQPEPPIQARKPVQATASAPTSLPKPVSSNKANKEQAAAKPRTAPSSRSASASRATPPTRPSRDGTPDLQSLGFPLPVIQSNLTSAPSPDRRASIVSTTAQRQQTSSTPLSGHAQLAQLHSPKRLPSGNGSSTSVTDVPTAPVSRERMPSQDSRQSGNEESGRKTRTPSPSVSTFRTRFPLFGRRTKTVPAPDAVASAEPKERPTRRGPAAGTGHEGYGRLGASRRRSSSTGYTSKATVSSQESLTGTQPKDTFLQDRMSPVVISGGEVVENKIVSLDLGRTESNTSYNMNRPGLDLHSGSQASLSSDGQSSLWPSAMPRETRLAANRNRRPSDSSDSEAGLMRPTLAYRRSIQRLQSVNDSQIRVPKSILTAQLPFPASVSLNSLDTGILSDDSVVESRPSAGRGRKDKPAPKKLTKRTRSPRKWNMFGRSHSQPALLGSSPAVAVTVEAFPLPERKPFAFYTMMDSSEQDESEMDIERVLREANVLPSPILKSLDEQARSRSPLQPQPTSPPPRHNDRTSWITLVPPLRPSAPVPEQQDLSRLEGVSTAQPIQQQQIQPESEPEKLSSQATRPERPRLQHVGRIPKVVSARQDQISPLSFSRPFNRASMHGSAPFDDILRAPSATNSLSPNPSSITNIAGSSTEFLAFPPRQNSGTTSTSQSSGALTFADSTAVVPDPCAPLVEDEIWDEYNDLLGEDVIKVPVSAGSSQGLPFYLEGAVPLSVKAMAKQMKLDDDMLESPTVVVYPQPKIQQYHRPTITSSVYSADLAAQVKAAIEGNLPPPLGQLPPTPFSVSEFVSGYGDRSSAASAGKAVAGPRRGSASSQRTGPRQTRTSDGSAYSQISEDNSPTAQVNLRVGSMTVSKWLTFGHVLFSPARDDLVPAVSPLNEHSVLVIDGLGNDDWSFYAAETYPSATFFNLSPRAPLPADRKTTASGLPLSPSNHHQIQYMSHADKFPFSPEMFTTVVYRFPAAAPESHYNNILNESRRVLKPGGYIELSILDLDLNSMGNRTRRAIRRLKEQMQTYAPDVHLGSTADAILRLLGSKGYTDIKSCRVGVPAASAIPRSSSETSANGVAGPRAGGMAKDDRSLAEMINDQSPVADESITNMVARVGRWWHGRCYRDVAMSFGLADDTAPVNSNMWTNRALLAECEEWGTTMKLTVCYARVPDIKRVASI